MVTYFFKFHGLGRLGRGMVGWLAYAQAMACGNQGSVQDIRDQIANHNQITANQSISPANLATPLETIVAAVGQIPERYNGLSLTVSFQSNSPKATFECRLWPARDFSVCPQGDRWIWPSLVQGQSYTLDVRAVADGRVDQSPKRVAFMADRYAGFPLGSTTKVIGNGQSLELPLGSEVNAESRATADAVASRMANGGTSRTLALGDSLAVIVPWNLSVSSFGSNWTYNATPLLIYDGRLSPLDGNCSQSWEMSRTVSGRRLCYATPTAAAWSQYKPSRPFNHIELVTNDIRGKGAESWLLTQSMAGGSPQKNSIPEDYQCPVGASRGSLALEGWRDFSGKGGRQLSMTWCSPNSSAIDGPAWLAEVRIPMQRVTDSGVAVYEAVVYYKASRLAGIPSWNQVQVQVGQIVKQALVATAPLQNR